MAGAPAEQPGTGTPANTPEAGVQPAAAGGETGDPNTAPAGKSKIEELRVIGGLIALCSGLLALVLLAGAALLHLSGEYGSAAVTAAISAIGTMVGAYFGVKIGNDGAKEAQETTKQVISAHEKASKEATGIAMAMHPEDIDKALDAIKKLL
jgi:hypothetical protein